MLTDSTIRNEGGIRELTSDEIATVAGGLMQRGGSPLFGIIDFLSDTIFRGTILDRLIDHFEQPKVRPMA